MFVFKLLTKVAELFQNIGGIIKSRSELVRGVGWRGSSSKKLSIRNLKTNKRPETEIERNIIIFQNCQIVLKVTIHFRNDTETLCIVEIPSWNS